MVENTIILQANITDNNGNNIKEGKVIFKINGTTIKDNNSTPIYANVTNGIATLQYIIPNGISAKDYNITAVYANKDYYRAQTVTSLTAQKIA